MRWRFCDCCTGASSSSSDARPQSAQQLDNIGGGASRDESEADYFVHVDGFEFRHRGRLRHTVYNISVIHGNARWPIRRRFRQVVALHKSLLQGLGMTAIKDGLPIPPAKVTCRSLWQGNRHERFLNVRALQLQRYFNDLLAYIPYVDQCEALREFLCSLDVNSMDYDALLDLEQSLGSGGSAVVVDPSAIEALPRYDKASGLLSTERCVICQEYLESEDDIRVLHCGHQYHFECIAHWIPHSNTCCICQSVAIAQSPAKEVADIESE